MARDQEGVFERQLAEAHKVWLAKVRSQRRPFKEWVGKTADEEPPEHVRQRIFDTWDRTCYLSTTIIDPAKGFDLEHVVRVKDGGAAANRESNLRPALRNPHIIKTAREKRDQASADRKKRKGAGTKAKPKKKIDGPEFEQTEPQARATKNLDSGKLGELRSLTAGGLARRFING
jgi:5-methylcytosine-specific restriction endonuclease McrA